MEEASRGWVTMWSFFFKREVQGGLVIQQVACFQLQSFALVEQTGEQAAEPMPAAGRA